MLNFPRSTYFGRKIPKEKFYANMEIDTALRQRFIAGIESVVWQNKLSKSTLNVAEGKDVIEIDILEVFLKKQESDNKLLEFMDKNLPHHIVFILRYGENAQIVVNYKTASENGTGGFKIGATYRTDWMNYGSLSLAVDGLNLDKVYENFILQVAGGKLKIANDSSLGYTIEKSKEREKLEEQIATLEAKIRKEKQFNVQVKLNNELRKLKADLLNMRGVNNE